MVKRYVLWETLWTNNGGAHPGMQAEMNWHKQTNLRFQETAYGGNSIDGRYLGKVDGVLLADLPKFLDSMRVFNMKEITVQEAIDFCNRCYPSESDPYFTLDDDGFTLIDNRPVEEI